MSYLVIENNGVADFNSLRLIGLSTKKPGDTTIGQFGSGFKYALAQCFREGIKPIICLGKEIIKTELKDDEIVYLKGNDIITSSIHPNFGQYDWNELWFILREFICNAIDSDGEGKIEGNHWKYTVINDIVPEDGKTKIYIDYNKFRFINLDNKFLITKPIFSCFSGKAYNTSHSAIYKKNIFVAESKTLFSYNFDSLKLTESRTSNPNAIEDCLEYFFCHCNDIEYFEHLFRNAKNNDELIEEFKAKPFNLNPVAAKAFNKVYGDNAVMITKDMPPGIMDRLRNYIIVDYLNDSWRNKLNNLGIKNWIDVCGKLAARQTSKIVNFVDSYGIVEEINNKLFKGKEVSVSWFEDPDNNIKGLADNTGISFNTNYYGNTVDFRMTVVEELVHYHYKFDDFSRSFQDAILKMLVERM